MRATLFQRVRQLLFGVADDGGNAAEGAGHANPPTQDWHEQAGRIQRLISHLDEQGSASLTAGSVQILGLDKIRARLGPQWESIADKALAIAEEVLAGHLDAGDIYRRAGEAAFQICFETGDQNYAKYQVGRISGAIEDRIAAELAETERDLSVETFVARVPCDRVRDSKDPMSALYSSLLEIKNAVATRQTRGHSIPALRYAGALFQPLWSSQDFGITKNRCVLDTLAGAAAAKHLEEIEELDDLVGALANLDCVLFTKSIEGLHLALPDVRQATIVIPVHFQTLVSGQPEFLDLASALPQSYRKLVLVDLIGVPIAATARELMRAIQTGRSVTDRIILQLSPSDHRLEQHMRALIWGVSRSLAELDSEDPEIAPDLSRFALLASEAGLCSFAYGANTIGKATIAAGAGFDYIGGTAVHSTVPVPRPHSRFTPLFGENGARPGRSEPEDGRRSHPRFVPLDPNSTITFPNGRQQSCRILNFSASGAAVSAGIAVEVGSHLALGSIVAQVVRMEKSKFGVRFLELQQPSIVEIALHTPIDRNQFQASLQAVAS